MITCVCLSEDFVITHAVVDKHNYYTSGVETESYVSWTALMESSVLQREDGPHQLHQCINASTSAKQVRYKWELKHEVGFKFCLRRLVQQWSVSGQRHGWYGQLTGTVSASSVAATPAASVSAWCRCIEPQLQLFFFLLLFTRRCHL